MSRQIMITTKKIAAEAERLERWSASLRGEAPWSSVLFVAYGDTEHEATVKLLGEVCIGDVFATQDVEAAERAAANEKHQRGQIGATP